VRGGEGVYMHAFGAGGGCCDALECVGIWLEFRCGGLGSQFDALASGDVRRDECKDDGAELTTRARPRNARREKRVP
jgi:hypothetical protein